MALVLPSDLYRSESVATVSGMSGTGAGLGTIVSTFLIGYVSDRYSFEPILITASFIPFIRDDPGADFNSSRDTDYAQT
jgi:ACS family hexuronate transporter-like MFS transporter